jgi:hypothetical protein
LCLHQRDHHPEYFPPSGSISLAPDAASLRCVV